MITVLKELEHILFSQIVNQDDSHLHRVSEERGVELSFDEFWCDLETFQAKPHSSRNLIASTTRKNAEMSLRQLDKESRTEFDIAKSTQIQSWLRYEAATASAEIKVSSPRPHEDAMGVKIQGIWQAKGHVW